MKSVLAIVLIVAAAESMHIPPEIEVTGSVYCDREGDPEPHMIKLELVQGVYDPPAKAIGNNFAFEDVKFKVRGHAYYPEFADIFLLIHHSCPTTDERVKAIELQGLSSTERRVNIGRIDL
ncbi:hypothetical protein AAVH_26726 [Aphelenchoides avenae]|nr:hypothetical protein AAVH_26726 [Aphelenchus avenae]